MKRNMIYVLCMLLAAFAFALPFARGSREINLDTLKKPLAPYLSGAYKPAAEKLSGLCAQTECTIGKSRRLRGWALCRCPDSSAAVPAAAAVEEGLVTVL